MALIDDPEAIPAHVADTLKEKDLNSNNTDKENDEVNGLDGVLYTAEEFFDEEIVAKAIKVDGKYRGWINPVVVEKYGLEEEAIKEEMGKNRNSNSSSSSTKGKPHGMSSARFASSQKLRKNPNAYFYRHNEPGLVGVLILTLCILLILPIFLTTTQQRGSRNNGRATGQKKKSTPSSTSRALMAAEINGVYLLPTSRIV